MAAPRPIFTASLAEVRLKSISVPLPRKMVVVPSKLSMLSRPVPATVTLTVALLPPAVTVIVPVPGAVAVKMPVLEMVPMSPVTVQVKASWSAWSAMWLYTAEATRAAEAPSATEMLETAVPLLLRTVMESGVSMAWTVVEPCLLPLYAVTVMSPPPAGVVSTLPSSVPSLVSRS